MSSSETSGIIHSIFSGAVNAMFYMPDSTRRMLTFTASEAVGYPDSITVSNGAFKAISSLEPGSAVIITGSQLSFPDIRLELDIPMEQIKYSTIRLPNPPALQPIDMNGFIASLQGFCGNKFNKSGFLHLPDTIRASVTNGLQLFAQAWAESDTILMEALLSAHIGIGIGLTPSSDDAFLGIMAVFSYCREYAGITPLQDNPQFQLWSALPPISSLTPFYRLLEGRTTDVSIKYLCCAQEGRYSDAILHLLEALNFTGQAITPRLIDLAHAGGTSGQDTLFGMNIACRVLQNY